MNSSRELIVPLVGAHFRPPAKWVIAALPAGASLRLEPEPENPYDPKAIRVIGNPSQVPESEHDNLRLNLEGGGFELTDVVELSELWLGYLADSDGKLGRNGGNREVAEMAQGAGVEVRELTATLTFDPAGKPIAKVTAP